MKTYFYVYQTVKRHPFAIPTVEVRNSILSHQQFVTAIRKYAETQKSSVILLNILGEQPPSSELWEIREAQSESEKIIELDDEDKAG